jgi:hypothetical protein
LSATGSTACAAPLQDCPAIRHRLAPRRGTPSTPERGEAAAARGYTLYARPPSPLSEARGVGRGGGWPQPTPPLPVSISIPRLSAQCTGLRNTKAARRPPYCYGGPRAHVLAAYDTRGRGDHHPAATPTSAQPEPKDQGHPVGRRAQAVDRLFRAPRPVAACAVYPPTRPPIHPRSI